MYCTRSAGVVRLPASSQLRDVQRQVWGQFRSMVLLRVRSIRHQELDILVTDHFGDHATSVMAWPGRDLWWVLMSVRRSFYRVHPNCLTLPTP